MGTKQEYMRQYYAVNREHLRRTANERVTASRLRNQQWIVTYLKDKQCLHCGITDTRVLDFDHIDPSTKKSNVADLVTKGYPIKRIEAEVAKCQLLCANCHRLKTWSERHGATYRCVNDAVTDS